MRSLLTWVVDTVLWAAVIYMAAAIVLRGPAPYTHQYQDPGTEYYGTRAGSGPLDWVCCRVLPW